MRRTLLLARDRRTRLVELGRAGLAANQHLGQLDERVVAGAHQRAERHALADDAQDFGIDIDLTANRRLPGLDDLAVGVDQFAHHARLVDGAAVGDRRRRDRHLQRRDGREPLSDRHVVGVAGAPLLAERLQLLLGRGDDAARLADQVDAGRRVEAYLARPFGQRLVADAVELHIAGDHAIVGQIVQPLLLAGMSGRILGIAIRVAAGDVIEKHVG